MPTMENVERNANGKVKTNDPQVTVTGTLKQGSQGELITFTLRLGFFELAFIVNIPEEGKFTAPVYVKWKIRHPDTAAHAEAA